MKRCNEKIKIIPMLYGALVCMAFILLLVIACTQNVQVFAARSEPEPYQVENAAFRESADASAPAGIRQTYDWTLAEQIEETSCLVFYTVHQYVDVYFDNELVYSLIPYADNRIGRTIGSNWIFIPLYSTDAGSEVRVEITPVYESARNRAVSFYVGSHLQIYLHQLKKDFPTIMLSILAITVGAVTVVVSLHKRFHLGHRHGQELVYLGITSIIIGLWKLTDTRFSPLLFPQNPLLLPDISHTMLLLGPVPLLLFMRSRSRSPSHRALDAVCLCSLLGSTIMIALQAANIVDFRESLPASHALILLTVATVAIYVFQEWRCGVRDVKCFTTTAGLLMCTAGALLDLLLYHFQGNSSNVLYTLVAFVAYVALSSIMFKRELEYQAHIDMHTGLYNKGSCNEQLSSEDPVEEPTAVFMFDLNELKRTNDTLGHDTGDTMIYQFADILRKNLPARSFVGRYGGDEFIAILHPANEETIRLALADVADAVERYNRRKEAQVPISYAAGTALSTAYPGDSMRALLDRADTNMYEDKRLKHAGRRRGASGEFS